MGTILDTDYLVVNRNGTDYKTTAADLDLYINPVPTFVTASVGTDVSNWSPYAQILEYPGNGPVDTSNYQDSWTWKAKHRNPDNLFNGKNVQRDDQFGYTVKNDYKTHLTFSYPEGIRVYNSIEFKGGFYASPAGDNNGVPCNIGTVSINGVDVFELAANDIDQKEFLVPYTGVLTQFSIRQKNDACSGGTCGYYSHAISYIKLDGKELLNQAATTLTFEPGEFFDRVKVGTNLQQVSPEVTGVVSKIEPGNKVILDDLYPEFATGSTIIIVGEDPLTSSASTRGVPVDNDYLVINRNNTDYKITTKDLKDYIYPVMPWEDITGLYHIIVPNQSTNIDIYPSNNEGLWNMDTLDALQRITAPGEYMVAGLLTKFVNVKGTWDFGPLTDTSGVTNYKDFLYQCNDFNGKFEGNWDTSQITTMEYIMSGCNSLESPDIGGWDTSKVENLRYAWNNCTKFNSDLSQWCVTSVTDYRFATNNCDAWEAKNQPVWGTCPRGEDQR